MDDWDSVPISDVCLSIRSGGTPSRRRSEYYDETGDGHCWVTTKELDDGPIADTMEHISDLGLAESSAKLLPPGSILIAMYAAPTAGRMGRLEVQAASNQAICALEVDGSIASRDWVFYALKAARPGLVALASGAAQQNLNKGHIESFSIPLPPLVKQRRIGSCLRILDDLILNNRRRIELLEETARLLYREWFVHFRYPGHEDVPLVDSELGPIPEHWRVEMLRDLAEVVKDTVDPAAIPSGSPLVGLEHLPRRSTTLADWDLATEVGSRRATFRDGDVLFGKIRPYFHKVVEAPFSGYCSTDAVVLRPVRDSDSAHLLSVVSSDDFIAHASASANGTKMPRANMDVLMRYPIPRPTESVSQAFEEAVKPLTELAKKLIRTNSRLIEARDLLLPRLVSGDLDISDLELDLETVG